MYNDETETNEYQCEVCGRWKTEEDIEKFDPCMCSVCYDNLTQNEEDDDDLED